MRPLYCSAILVLTTSLTPAFAGSADPYVIRGVAPAQADVQPARGAYGGGFIEMLVTGSAPGSANNVRYNSPDPRLQSDQQAMMSQPQPMQQRGMSRSQPALYAQPQAFAAPQAGYVPHAMRPEFQRQEVAYDGPERPGTIVVDTPRKFLFLVTGPGRAMRYGIGVGRPGFEWAGVKTISRKAEWPDWTPPPEMLKRRPDLPIHMAGGPANPLGARALYLGSSLYRIHGTNEPDTIGTNVSSGCIRMMNEDVTDLYDRVRVGTRVIVM
jgi:lipoprotein-anchoring transpeptidase ErfK/SrfK